MGDRCNTVVCIFNQSSPRIPAYKIHKWIHDRLQVLEHSVQMIQIDGTKRHVYIKFVDDSYAQDILWTTNGQADYKHVTGEISHVCIELASMGMRCVWIANLLPEVPDGTIRVISLFRVVVQVSHTAKRQRTFGVQV
jgi:hypothetical protein